MIRETSHLGEITHGRFAAVSLPVGIGCKGCCGAKCQPGFQIRKFLRIEREELLHAFDYIQKSHGHAAEEQHCDGVFCPTHLMFFVDACEAIDEFFDWAQHPVQKSLLAIKHPSQKHAQRLSNQKNHQ